jgi:hypothetical protein
LLLERTSAAAVDDAAAALHDMPLHHEVDRLIASQPL